MHEGPGGFPRLTTLGPLVKSSDITPHKDIDTGVYSIEYIEDVQSKTAEDTLRALEDITRYELDVFSELRPEDAMFEYRLENIENLLRINHFSASLLHAMSLAEDAGIPLSGNETDRYDIDNPPLQQEVEDFMNGEDSIFTDEIISGVSNTWARICNGQISSHETESELRQEVVDKVIGDFDRVTRISSDIRSSKVYYPPTTENVNIEQRVGWGTIDGAHRLVALSQILGQEEQIYIWEWSNQKEYIDRSSMF